ncbi:excinuclease ABC subunit UvrC [Desulfosarcina sp. OttesenSCG-928-B08]|nr:excinuclease ABC subunit UvrC [Desulfosarcina sp. OttesenSCG-928-B08]
MTTHPAPRTPQFLDARLATIPETPGVYLMKDAAGVIIYVGKAIHLKKRVNSYFQRPEGHAARIALMVSRIADIDTIVTSSEKEALILESSLIKQHRPRFNVVLKDDKRYPSVRIQVRTDYPRLEIVRKTPKDGALYLGPFASTQAIRQTLKLINKTFPLRKCSDRAMAGRSRPCLHHQMGQCLAPCCHKVDPADYKKVIGEVILFLKGRTPQLVRRLRRQMQEAAENQQFEAAARLRDRMFALEKTLERQVMVTTDFTDRDVIGISGNSDFRVMAVMTVRRGYLKGVQQFELTRAAPEEGELVAQFIGQYYSEAHEIPPEILVPVLPDNTGLLEETLSDWKGRRVRVKQPIRGEMRQLLSMAETNAENTLRERVQQASSDAAILEELQGRLHMDRMPSRIECFDNSHLTGTNPVSAMVVFVDGRPQKSGYRRYTLKTPTIADDYANMAEVLERRYKKMNAESPMPDLLLVDGGKGQVSIAVSIVESLGLSGAFAIAGIAKKDPEKGETEDKIYLPNRSNPVNLGRDGRLLLLLQRIRDEAHRFVITFQRKKRSRSMVTSVLDAVPGIGPKRKAMLLKQFGSIKKIRAAAESELCELPGIDPAMARAIKAALE